MAKLTLVPVDLVEKFPYSGLDFSHSLVEAFSIYVGRVNQLIRAISASDDDFEKTSWEFTPTRDPFYGHLALFGEDGDVVEGENHVGTFQTLILALQAYSEDCLSDIDDFEWVDAWSQTLRSDTDVF